MWSSAGACFGTGIFIWDTLCGVLRKQGKTARAYRGWCQHGDTLAWKGPLVSRIGDVLSEEHPVLNATAWEPSFKGVVRWVDLSFASPQAVRALGEFEGF